MNVIVTWKVLHRLADMAKTGRKVRRHQTDCRERKQPRKSGSMKPKPFFCVREVGMQSLSCAGMHAYMVSCMHGGLGMFLCMHGFFFNRWFLQPFSGCGLPAGPNGPCSAGGWEGLTKPEHRHVLYPANLLPSAGDKAKADFGGLPNSAGHWQGHSLKIYTQQNTCTTCDVPIWLVIWLHLTCPSMIDVAVLDCCQSGKAFTDPSGWRKLLSLQAFLLGFENWFMHAVFLFWGCSRCQWMCWTDCPRQVVVGWRISLIVYSGPGRMKKLQRAWTWQWEMWRCKWKGKQQHRTHRKLKAPAALQKQKVVKGRSYWLRTICMHEGFQPYIHVWMHRCMNVPAWPFARPAKRKRDPVERLRECGAKPKAKVQKKPPAVQHAKPSEGDVQANCNNRSNPRRQAFTCAKCEPKESVHRTEPSCRPWPS